MNGFVGVSERLLTAEELQQLCKNLSTSVSCYCLRSPDSLKWVEDKFPDKLPSPEGEMFNAECALRWQQETGGYSVLLLSTAGLETNFKPIGEKWEVQQRDAYLHPPTETRFPQGIPATKINIAQRYFIDAKTATVRFVALTVVKKP